MHCFHHCQINTQHYKTICFGDIFRLRLQVLVTRGPRENTHPVGSHNDGERSSIWEVAISECFILKEDNGWKSNWSAKASSSSSAAAKVGVVVVLVQWQYYNSSSSSSSKKSSPVTGLEWPRGFQDVKVPRFHDNGTGWWQGCQPYAPAAFTPRKYIWYSFLLEAESTPGP